MAYINEKKAQKEMECYMYCLYRSLECFDNKEFENASIFLENAARSLKALEELKVDEKQSDHVVNVFIVSRNYDGNY